MTTWALDLDGVVWRGSEPIAGSADAIAELRDRAVRVVYVTNSSWQRTEAYIEKLSAMGVEAETDSLVHGGVAVGELVSAGERVLVCAGAGVEEGLTSARAQPVVPDESMGETPPAVDAVVVGWRPNYDLRLLTLATRAVLAGARLVATNKDPLYPREDGLMPGTGSLVAAVAQATGATPTYGGKPLSPMADLVMRRFGTVDVMVGDSPETDGGLAARLGCRFVHVASGVATAPSSGVQVDARVNDLKEAVEHLRDDLPASRDA